MDVLIWVGAVVTLGGILGLVQCGRLSMRAKGLGEEEARAAMAKVITLNLTSMGLAVLGLMITIAGLILR
jgi:hypothetical protein